MALPLNPTLADLRGYLQSRCGFGNQGPPSLLERSNYDGILEQSQEQIWDELQLQQKHDTVDLAFVTGQTLYDWPDDVAPEWLTRIQVFYASVWQTLYRGIESHHDTFVTTGASYPQRFDFKADQLEIWPEPESDYTGRIEFYPRLGRLTQDADRATVPPRLLRALSLYYAKAHYRQPDAEAHLAAYERMKRRIMLGQNTGRRFVRTTRGRRTRVDSTTDHDPYCPRPIME